jgi:rhodanese-related sulfurtransferase
MKKMLTIHAILIFILCLGFVLPALGTRDGTRIVAVSAKEAANLIDKHNGNPGFAILDIRTPDEFQSGHLSNAISIDFYSQDFAEKLSRLDKEKTYLVYCRTGNRSTRALAFFDKLKFQKIYHLSTGIRGWQSEDLPVTK